MGDILVFRSDSGARKIEVSRFSREKHSRYFDMRYEWGQSEYFLRNSPFDTLIDFRNRNGSVWVKG